MRGYLLFDIPQAVFFFGWSEDIVVIWRRNRKTLSRRWLEGRRHLGSIMCTSVYYYSLALDDNESDGLCYVLFRVEPKSHLLYEPGILFL